MSCFRGLTDTGYAPFAALYLNQQSHYRSLSWHSAKAHWWDPINDVQAGVVEPLFKAIGPGKFTDTRLK